MDDKWVLQKITAIASRILPKRSKLILFGSRARGSARKESDWDLLIVVDNDKLSYETRAELTYPFVTLGWEIGTDINPVIYTAKKWMAQHITPFYHNVVKDGIQLWG